jgi:hypothetical protein
MPARSSVANAANDALWSCLATDPNSSAGPGLALLLGSYCGSPSARPSRRSLGRNARRGKGTMPARSSVANAANDALWSCLATDPNSSAGPGLALLLGMILKWD